MADHSPIPQNALIIGGGIAGLAAAIFLKRVGINSRVFEAYPSLTDIGGGMQIFPNGMRILETLGLKQKAIDSGALLTEARFKDLKGKTFLRSSMGTIERHHHPTITIRRSVLHKLLVDECERNTIFVEYGKKICAIEDANNQVTTKFSDDTSATGKFLIGADGVHSFVRKYILPDCPNALYSNLIGFLGFVPEESLEPSFRPGTSMEITVGPVGYFSYCNADNRDMAKADSDLLWFCYLSQKKKLSKEELTAMTDADAMQRVLRAHQNWPQPISTLVQNSTSISIVSVSDIMGLKTWHKGRVVLVGDAAHAMNPINGQGASTSLEDAMLLAELLKQNPDQLTEVFEKFEAIRKPRVEKMVVKGRRSSQKSMIRVGRWGTWFRNIAFAMLTRLTSQRWADWVYNYDPLSDQSVLRG